MNLKLTFFAIFVFFLLATVTTTNVVDAIRDCSGYIEGLPSFIVAAPGEKVSISAKHETWDKVCNIIDLDSSFTADIPSLTSSLTRPSHNELAVNFTIPEQTKPGLYNAKIKFENMTYGLISTTQKLFVRVTDIPSIQTYELQIRDNVIKLLWHMETGKISRISVDPRSTSLLLTLERTQARNDFLLLALPSKLIDYANGFDVTVNDEKVCYEVTIGNEEKMLAIPLLDDSNKIQISGSYIMPESRENLLWSYDPEGSVSALAMSRDGLHITAGVSSDIGSSVHLLDKEGVVLWQHALSWAVRHITLSDDGSYVVATTSEGIPGGVPGSINRGIFFLSKDGILWNYTVPDTFYVRGGLLPLSPPSLSTDASFVAVPVENTILYFDKQGNIMWNHTLGINIAAVEVSSDGEYVVVIAGIEYSDNPASYDLGIFFFDREGKLLWNHTDPNVYIWGDYSLAMTPNAEYIVVAELNRNTINRDEVSNVSIFNRDGELIRKIHFDTQIPQVRISSNGSYIAVGNRGSDDTSSSIFLFDGDGNMLWNYTGAGFPFEMTPDGSFILAQSVLLDKQGNVVSRYVTSGSLEISPDGSYVVIAASPPSLYDYSIYVFDGSQGRNDSEIRVDYGFSPSMEELASESQLTNGHILSVEGQIESNSIIFSLCADKERDGMLVVTLPRGLIDAKINNTDKSFSVLVDGNSAEFVESEATESHRRLHIPVLAGTEEVKIIGTHVIPEFPIALLVLAGSIVGVIVAARWLQRRPRYFPLEGHGYPC